MAHMTKKSAFIALVSTMQKPKLRTFRGSVYLRDGENTQSEVEIYCASSMCEKGVLSSMNQAAKYRNWI